MDKFESKVLNALDKLEAEGKIESVPVDEPKGCTMNEKGSLVYPELITEVYGEFTFKYYIEPKKEYEQLRFLSRDIYEILGITDPNINRIIVLTDINSDLEPTKRPENINYAIREFAEAHSDMLIAIQLYVIGNTEEQATIHRNTSFIETVIDLEEAGFVDINNFCQFENSIAFVYRNDHSKNLLRCITRLLLRDNEINGIDLTFGDASKEWHYHLPEKFGLRTKPNWHDDSADSKEDLPDDYRGPNAL